MVIEQVGIDDGIDFKMLFDEVKLIHMFRIPYPGYDAVAPHFLAMEAINIFFSSLSVTVRR